MPSKNQIKQYIREVRIAHDSRIADSLGGGVISGGGSAGVSVLSTVPATVDGGYWYELTDNKPMIWVHQGNYNYGFNYDTREFVGDASAALFAYLPFDVSTTADACGNTWTATGNPVIQNGKIYFNGSSYLSNSSISDSIGFSSWTIDFWATNEANNYFFGTLGNPNVQWVSLAWISAPYLIMASDDHKVSGNFTSGTRYHYAVTYDKTTIRVFVNGTLGLALDRKITLNGDFRIGAAPDGRYYKGTIEKFRIFKDVALWTEDFTPTAADYE